VTFELFVRPALLRMGGCRAVFAPVVPARLRDPIRGSSDVTQFLRVRLSAGEGTTRDADLTGPQGSGMLTSMAAADALLVVQPGGGPPDAVHRAIVLGGRPLGSDPGY
jgi:molybdopterin molybdotransferase